MGSLNKSHNTNSNDTSAVFSPKAFYSVNNEGKKYMDKSSSVCSDEQSAENSGVWNRKRPVIETEENAKSLSVCSDEQSPENSGVWNRKRSVIETEENDKSLSVCSDEQSAENSGVWNRKRSVKETETNDN